MTAGDASPIPKTTIAFAETGRGRRVSPGNEAIATIGAVKSAIRSMTAVSSRTANEASP
jgi:hypothetical protein